VSAASAQFGTVVRHKKISEVSGLFPGGLEPNDQMGRAVISAGDIDGDGNADLVSGAIGDDDGGTLGLDSDTGALWVHFLNANGGLLRNTKISMTTGGLVATLDNRDQLGRALERLGDFDGDGVPDIAAGACRDDDGGVNRGAIYLLFLNRNGTVKSQAKISDTQGNFQGVLEDLDEFGRAIANMGDLDGNGVIDLAVGAIGDDDGGADQKGAAWILFLNADGTVLGEQKISMTQGGFKGALGGGDLFGFALANVGDVDGDGVTDLAVGTPKDDDGGVRKGAVWLLFLRADGTVKGHKKISDIGGVYGLQPGNEFGSSIAGLGDLDGDGIPDMAVGAPLDDGALHDQGAVWINFMNADGSVKSKQKVNDVSGNFQGGLADDDWFGMALGTMRDLDGDGRAELAVGARYDDDGGINTGSVWILFLDGVFNVPPTPAFTPVPAAGVAPLVVQFANRCSAGADTWDWDFGDGTGSTLQKPKHTYTVPGRYTVTLTVGGPGGSATLELPDAVLAQHMAQATLRNGSGVNRVAFQSKSPPVLGTNWTSEVDATPHPGAGLSVLFATSAPQQGLFLRGRELLVLLPAQGAHKYFTRSVPSGGGVAQHSVALPNDLALLGLNASVQAFVLGGGSIEFCNAIDLVLGY
jgi:PKD repeat protein